MEESRKRSKLRRSLQLYFSKKLKKIPPIHIRSSNIPASITSSRLLSTCRCPTTPSLDGDQAAADTGKDQAATLSDVDRFLFDNFRSLYIHDRDANACNLPSPGTSTSLLNETQPTAKTSSLSESITEDITEANPGEESGSNTAIMLFSVDPYKDFRRSMHNMIIMHHGQESQPLDWDFLEDLLFYYLQLNDQSVHKYILKAFADLTAGTHNSSPARGKAPRADNGVRGRKHKDI